MKYFLIRVCFGFTAAESESQTFLIGGIPADSFSKYSLSAYCVQEALSPVLYADKPSGK